MQEGNWSGWREYEFIVTKTHISCLVQNLEDTWFMRDVRLKFNSVGVERIELSASRTRTERSTDDLHPVDTVIISHLLGDLTER